MKTSIEVTSRAEARQLQQGLNDPAVRAFVLVMGALAQLPSVRSQQRVLQFVKDHFEEHPSQPGDGAGDKLL